MIRKILAKVVICIVLAVAVVWTITPVMWMISLSFKTYGEWRTPSLIPHNPTLDNYIMLFSPQSITTIFIAYTAVLEPITRPLIRSLIISATATVIAIIIGFFTAYGASRYNSPGSFTLFFTLLTRMLPPAVFVTPIVIYFTTLALIDNIIGLALLYAATTLTYAVWILKGFIDAIPIEWEEAALLEGASPLQAIFKVVIPIVRPGMVVAGLFIFLMSWTELLFALVLTNLNVPLSVQVSKYVTAVGALWGVQAAAALVSSIIPLVIGYLIQRHLITGFTFGLVRG
jgi:multiple sugar transport system permease protein